jgi:hypothetical protein
VKVRVYLYREDFTDLGWRPIGPQALETIYDLVWESELKNVITVGRIWLAFRNDDAPFGRPLKEKRPHDRIAKGDIIQAGDEYFAVMDVGVRKVSLRKVKEG